MRLLVAALSLLLLTLGIVRNAWPWIVDDAFISLRYAERFVAGDGLTWTDGEAVEGYSNLAWVLLCAALGWLDVDLVLAVRILGTACTVATFFVLLRGRLLPESLASRLCVALMAALATTSVWAIGGLEAPLLMLLLAVAMQAVDVATIPTQARWRGALLLAGAALAVACWTRPDAPLWTALGATMLFVFRPIAAAGRLQPALWFSVLPMLAVLAQLAFRLAYYGDYVPNTAHAKLTSSSAARDQGMLYIVSAAIAMRALLLPSALGLVAMLTRRTRFVIAYAAVGTLAWWLYIFSVGGDTFPRSRLLLPTLAPLTVLAAHGIDLIAARGRRAAGFATAVIALLIGLARFDAEGPNNDPRQRLPNWEWLGVGTGTWLGRAFAREQPLLAVDAAGAVPFASKLPCLDMLGLNDRTIATTEPPADHRFVPGHHRANGAYVLSRRPDLVMFSLPPGSPQPQWLGGKQLEALQEFRDLYRVLLFATGPMPLGDGRTEDLRITVWGRLEGRIGVTRDDTTVRVPGFWLGSFRQPCSFFAPQQESQPDLAALRLATLATGSQWWLQARAVGVLHDGIVQCELRAAGGHVLDSLPLAVGRWQLETEPKLPGARLSLEAAANCAVQADTDAFVVRANGTGAPLVNLVLELPADAALPLHLRALTLRQTDQK